MRYRSFRPGQPGEFPRNITIHRRFRCAAAGAVNKMLRRFQDDGLTSIEHGRLQIHFIDRLQRES